MAAFKATQIAVGTSATVLVSGLEGRYQIVLQISGTSGFAIGQSNVSFSGGVPSNGFTLPNGTLTLDVNLDSTDALYGVSYSGTNPVQVLVSPR